MSLGLLLLENLQHQLLLDLGHFVDLLSHPANDVHDYVGKVAYSSCIVK